MENDKKITWDDVNEVFQTNSVMEKGDKELLEYLKILCSTQIRSDENRLLANNRCITINTILMNRYFERENAKTTFYTKVVIILAIASVAAALIQKREKLEAVELKTVFTVQQALIVLLLIVVFISTPLIKNIYNLDQKAVYLLWALTFSLLFSSLKTIPSVLMERKLEFNKWVIPQIIETIVFNLTAVYLAWRGFGITSYTVAVLLSGLLGLVITYIVQPWFPRFAFSLKAFKTLG